jgi:hypothetical protein
MENQTERELTFGEKAVGLNFNPSGDEKVNKAKRLMADALDLLKDSELKKQNTEIKSQVGKQMFLEQTLSKIVDAQMSLVKYITWK